MEKIDIFLLFGQSNAKGMGNKNESVLPNENVFEVLSNGTIINMKTTLETSGGKGCIAPAFANMYNSMTKRKVVIIHFAKDGSRIKNWNHDFSFLLDECIKRFNNACEVVSQKYEINSKYAIWIQGESDAKYGSDILYYKEQLEGIAKKLYDVCKIQKTFVSLIGYWLGNEDYIKRTKLIASIQELACKENKYLELGSKRAMTFHDEKLTVDEVHYNQKGYNILGEDLAKNIYKYDVTKESIEIEDTINLQKEKRYIQKLIKLKMEENI